jgi:hypothetical protein
MTLFVAMRIIGARSALQPEHRPEPALLFLLWMELRLLGLHILDSRRDETSRYGVHRWVDQPSVLLNLQVNLVALVAHASHFGWHHRCKTLTVLVRSF